jgi:phage gp45-like
MDADGLRGSEQLMSAVKRLYDRTVAALGLFRGELPADGGSPIQKIQVISVTTGGRQAGVPFMQHYGFASRPHAGCDYALLALGGDPTKSVIIASNDQRYQFPLAEGEAAFFDDLVQSVHLTRTGIVWTDQFQNTITSGAEGFVMADKFGNQIVTGATGILLKSCTGVVTVDNEIAGTEESGLGASFTGTVKTTGDVIAGAGGADQISLLDHTHKYLPGSGSVTDTAAPTAGT